MSSVSSDQDSKHTCQLCGLETLQKTNLKQLQEAVHEGKQFQCPEFEHQASYKSNLVKHQNSVHMGQKFQCPECEYQATQKSNLVRHHKSLHMQQKSRL